MKSLKLMTLQDTFEFLDSTIFGFWLFRRHYRQAAFKLPVPRLRHAWASAITRMNFCGAIVLSARKFFVLISHGYELKGRVKSLASDAR